MPSSLISPDLLRRLEQLEQVCAEGEANLNDHLRRAAFESVAQSLAVILSDFLDPNG